MENDPRKMELNFNFADSDEKGAENDSVHVEDIQLESQVVPGAGDKSGENFATAGFNIAANGSNVTDDLADIPRSRLPMNCPAGTMPLEEKPAVRKISEAELAVVGKSFGTALRMLREHHQLDRKALEQATLIQARYLEALENEDLKALPPLAFVIGYIRSLCSFYKLSDETTGQMVAKLKEQLEYSCNDAMMKSLEVDAAGEEVNARRMKHIVWGLAGAVVLVAVLITLGVILLSQKNTPNVTVVKPAAGQQHFDPNTIYPLLEPPTLDLPKLPVAE